MNIADAHKIRWQAHVDAEWHPDWGFEQYFMEHPEIGSPLTEQEGTLDDGRPFRVFSNGAFAFGPNGVEPI